MKMKAVCFALLFCLAATAMASTDDANVGTWKLNEAKSKFAAGASKNTSVVYSMSGDKFKCVVDGVDGTGKATHNEWTGLFDGKDYAVTGDPTADTRSIQKLNARMYKLNNKKAGKVVVSGTIALSKDGKTRTLKTHGKDANGKPTTSVAVYDKQ